MLTIRLTRKGKKNQPFFKVVVIDKRRSTKGGRAVEVLGFVDPLTKKRHLKKERILYWIKNGAKTSATMNNLLIQEKIIEGQKIHVSKISKKRQVKVDAAKASVTPISAPTPTPVVEEKPTEIAPEIVPPAEEKLIEAPAEQAKETLKEEVKQ